MTPQSGKVALDRTFLETRARLLDVAANLDRLDRAADAAAVATDPRLAKIRAALAILSADRPDRAEAIQQLFSLDYDPDWPRPLPPVIA